MKHYAVWMGVLSGLLFFGGCAELESPIGFRGAVDLKGLSIPGLIEYATVTHKIGPLDNPAAVRRLAQTKFRHLSLAYLRQLPEYKQKRNAIVRRASREKTRVASRPDLNPVQRQEALAEIDENVASEIESLDSDPELLALVAPYMQKRDFFIPYGKGIVKASTTVPHDFRTEEEVWATTAPNPATLVTAVDGPINRTNIDLELTAVLAKLDTPLPSPDS